MAIDELPDIDNDSWQRFSANQFRADTDQQVGALGILAQPPPPPPASPAEGLERVGGWASPAPLPAPEPPEPPAQDPFQASSDAQIATLATPPPTAATLSPRAAGPARPTAPYPGRPAPPDLVSSALQAADEAGVDPALYAQVVQQESAWDPTARSPAGAQGLSQLMPDTARGLGVSNPFDPLENLKGGARYLKQQLDAFGGDVTRALAAYNAGAGAVQRYGGVPPYEETQRYVSTILDRLAAEQSTNPAGGGAPGPREGITRAGAALSAANQTRDISQFGDAQLTTEEAYAACGPAAAVRFAQRFGRNPSLREALDLAKTVGWTTEQGMAGLASERALMSKLDIPTKLVPGAAWDQFAAEAQTGNPVTISTRGHYFTADGYDASSGRFHVGRSGLDLKGGSEWMTSADMERLMGPVQGGLLADNPQVPAPSTADAGSASWFDRTKSYLEQGFSNGTDQTAAAAAPSRALEAPGEGFDPTSILPRTAPAAAVFAEPAPQQNVWDQIGTGIANVFRNAFGGGGGPQGPARAPGPLDVAGGAAVEPAVSPVPAPGFGYDPSALRPVTEPPGPGVPLRQDVRDLGQPSQPTVFDELGDELSGERARRAREAPYSPEFQARAAEVAATPVTIPTNPLELLGGAGLGVPTSGEAIDRARQQWIEEHNPLRDVPVVGGLTTLGAQMATDPTNLVLGLPYGARTAARYGPEVAEAAAQAARTRLPAEAEIGFAMGRPTGGEPPLTPPRGGEPPPPPPPPPGRPSRTELPQVTPPEGARPIGLTTAEEVERLRLDQWPEELRDTIRQGAEARDFGRTQRRGVIADDVSEQMADDLGRTLDDWVKGGKAGKAYNAEELRALRNAVGAQAERTRDLSAQVADARRTGNLTDNLLVRQFSEGQKLQALTEILQGATAEWGRAGRAFQGAARLVDLPPDEATARIYQMLGGRDNALKALDEYQKLLDSGAGVIEQARFWAGVKHPPPGVEDWFRLLRYNSMLSGPRTAEVNVIGNALEIPWRLARDSLASTLRGNPRELSPELAGLAAGFAKGRQKFLQVWSDGITAEAAARGDLPRDLSARVRNPVGKAAARFLEQPGRTMVGLDEWAHAMAYEMGLGRRAGVMASRERLTGKAWDARVAELLGEPTAAMVREASGIADRMTYRGDMGTLGRALEGVQKVPYLGAVLLPFLRTVYHIAARGIDRSPAGFAFGTLPDVARGTYGRSPSQVWRALAGEGAENLPKTVVPLGERLGDNVLGSLAFYGFYQKALEGNISGAGPDDPEKRDMLRAQGWQPYSIRIGGNWVSYSNWGPVAIPLSMAAAAAEAQTYHKPGADAGAILVDGIARTAKLATEQSYLQGIGAVYKGLTEPDRFGSQFVGQFVQSLIPYGSALNTLGQATDPTVRQPQRDNFGEFLKQSVESRLPGLRQNVPEAQDQLGRPIPNEQTGVGALNPLRSSTIRSNAVLQELLRNGADVGDPPKSFRSVPLTPDEQRTFNTAAGQYIEQAVSGLMLNGDYRAMPPEQKQAALQRAVEAARTRAGAELMQTIGTSEASRRVAEGRAKKVPVPIGQ
jgi:soluble lytic murein transglycosylase-like protein